MSTKEFTGDDHGEAMLQGANACLDALRAIQTVSETMGNPDTEIGERLQAKKLAADILLRASGGATPHIAGFMTVLGEYVDFVNSLGVPNLATGGWVPDAVMTEAQLAAHRQELEAY